jgi:hypothetical protein
MCDQSEGVVLLLEKKPQVACLKLNSTTVCGTTNRRVCQSSDTPHLPGRASDRAISMISSRPAVGSSRFQATPSPILKSMPLTFLDSPPVRHILRPFRHQADAKTDRDQRHQREGVVAGVSHIVGEIVFLEHFRKIALAVREVLTGKGDDLLTRSSRSISLLNDSGLSLATANR